MNLPHRTCCFDTCKGQSLKRLDISGNKASSLYCVTTAITKSIRHVSVVNVSGNPMTINAVRLNFFTRTALKRAQKYIPITDGSFYTVDERLRGDPLKLVFNKYTL